MEAPRGIQGPPSEEPPKPSGWKKVAPQKEKIRQAWAGKGKKENIPQSKPVSKGEEISLEKKLKPKYEALAKELDGIVEFSMLGLEIEPPNPQLVMAFKATPNATTFRQLHAAVKTIPHFDEQIDPALLLYEKVQEAKEELVKSPAAQRLYMQAVANLNKHLL